MSYEVVDLEKSPRSRAFDMFKDSRMPIMVLTSKLDILPLIKLKSKGYNLNAMLMYSILQAGRKFDGCYYDIKDGKLIKYDDICVDMVVEGKDKNLYYTDVPYFDNFQDFQEEYSKRKKYCYENCCSKKFDDKATLSTSAVVNRVFEAIYPNFSDEFINPFFVWGKSERGLLKDNLNVSLRVHHAFMDGKEVGQLFNEIQSEIDNFKHNLQVSSPNM